MNTHDIDIHTAIMDVITDVWDRAKQINDATYEVLDLIEADRKRRGEPVACGWQSVPKVPTEEMLNAADARVGSWQRAESESAYRAMLEAAPEPPSSD